MSKIRAPTAIWVTLLGALLSVWILPAITRQWQDRQKARDLNADIAQTVAVATSKATSVQTLLLAHPSEGRSKSVLSREGSALQRRWANDHMVISARIAAYYPRTSPVMRTWRAYSDLVSNFLVVGSYLAGSEPGEGFQVAAPLDAQERDFIKTVVGPSCTRPELAQVMDSFRLYRSVGLTELSRIVFRRYESFTRAIIEGHPRGYSVSRTDLLHDLFP